MLEILTTRTNSSQVIPPAKPYFPKFGIEEMKTHVERILDSGMLTFGEYTKQFEQMFATSTNVRHAVGVNSETNALEISWPPLHLQPAHREFVSDKERFDVMEECGRRVAKPPMFSHMTTDQAERVLQVSRDALS